MKKFLLVFFLLISFNSNADDLVIVDIDYILTNSKIGKSTNTNLQNSKKKMLDNFKKQETKFRESEKQVLSKKNILSEDEFKKEIKKLKDEVGTYRDKKKKTLDDYRVKREKEYTKLYKKINDILIEYSKKNNIKTVIDKKYVLISKAETDITKQIIKLVDN